MAIAVCSILLCLYDAFWRYLESPKHSSQSLRYLQKSYKPDEWSMAAEPDDDWASSVVDKAPRFLGPPRAFSVLPTSKWKAKSNVA